MNFLNVVIILLFFLDLMTVCTSTSLMKESHICEHNSGTISCDDGKYISIINGWYGRQIFSTNCGSLSLIQSCLDNSAMNIMISKCDRKTRCTLTASNDIFGDPCVGYSNYLYVKYECMETSRNGDTLDIALISWFLTTPTQLVRSTQYSTTPTQSPQDTNEPMLGSATLTIIISICVFLGVTIVSCTVCFWRRKRVNIKSQGGKISKRFYLPQNSNVNTRHANFPNVPTSDAIKYSVSECANIDEPSDSNDKSLSADKQISVTRGKIAIPIKKGTNLEAFGHSSQSKHKILNDKEYGYITPETVKKPNVNLAKYEVFMKGNNVTPELDAYVQPMKLFKCNTESVKKTDINPAEYEVFMKDSNITPELNGYVQSMNSVSLSASEDYVELEGNVEECENIDEPVYATIASPDDNPRTKTELSKTF